VMSVCMRWWACGVGTGSVLGGHVSWVCATGCVYEESGCIVLVWDGDGCVASVGQNWCAVDWVFGVQRVWCGTGYVRGFR
jgi:hypothetical protein